MKYSAKEEFDFLTSNQITRLDLQYKLDYIKNDLLNNLSEKIDDIDPNNTYELLKYDLVLDRVLSIFNVS